MRLCALSLCVSPQVSAWRRVCLWVCACVCARARATLPLCEGFYGPCTSRRDESCLAKKNISLASPPTTRRKLRKARGEKGCARRRTYGSYYYFRADVRVTNEPGDIRAVETQSRWDARDYLDACFPRLPILSLFISNVRHYVKYRQTHPRGMSTGDELFIKTHQLARTVANARRRNRARR